MTTLFQEDNISGTNASLTYGPQLQRYNVRRPKVVTSAHSSVRPIVTLAVSFENTFVEAKRIILKESTIQISTVFMRRTSKIALFIEEGRVDDF